MCIRDRSNTAGVIQGSVLGPLLFSVFVSDMPRVTGVRLSLFADDTAAFAEETNAYFAAINSANSTHMLGVPRTGELPLTLLRAQR